MPYLAVEHRRLEPWKMAGFWIGDIMGLLWFLRFTFAHAVLGDPLAPVPASDGRRSLRLLVWAGVAAILIDLALSLYLMRDERDGYTRARVAEAQVFAITEHKRPEATGYDLDCTFRDEAGTPHQTHLRVLASHHVLPATLPAEAARVLSLRGEGQNIIRIRHDLRLPERAWIDGLGWEDENGLYWFSVGTSVLQAAVTALFLLFLSRYSASGVWPWWWDIYKVLPLAVETFCLLAMGLIDRLMDSLA
jgi:hypothetical protein